jgi:ectoine hydroxylase-related dioxygenase (phytanoyl-CoA dioxygenase family)
MTSNGIDRIDNVVAAPLHYDSYGAPTLTTWVPLQNITAQTGSLCFTYSQNLIKLTGAGLSPYDMHTIGLSEEIKNSYINSLRNELEYVECNAGQVFIFDKNLLHGSTYPISAERVSVDIRWIKSELSESDNRQRIQKTLLRIRRNALRAIYLNGDTKFLSRIKITDFFATHLKMRLRRFRALQILHRKFKG